MNRAWIPAGALAGVSVAGLLALGPLTDSMGTSVPFPGAITVSQGTASPGTAKPGSTHELRAVKLKINLGTVGSVIHSSKGGRVPAADPNSTTGLAGYRKTTGSSTGSATIHTAPAAKPKKPVKKPVKKVTRKSISTSGETNGNSGLAGSGSNSTGSGEQSQTPSSDGP